MRRPAILLLTLLLTTVACNKTRDCGPATVTAKWKALGLPLEGAVCKCDDGRMEVQITGKAAADVLKSYEAHLVSKGWEKKQTQNASGAVGLAFTKDGPTVLSVIVSEPPGYDNKPVVITLDFF